jgi:hypothetical protein
VAGKDLEYDLPDYGSKPGAPGTNPQIPRLFIQDPDELDSMVEGTPLGLCNICIGNRVGEEAKGFPDGVPAVRKAITHISSLVSSVAGGQLLTMFIPVPVCYQHIAVQSAPVSRSGLDLRGRMGG